jgi:predicted protein tyrosine phosphatase
MSSPVEDHFLMDQHPCGILEAAAKNTTTMTKCDCLLEAQVLKSSKILAQVKKSHRRKISQQYLPKYVSTFRSICL